MTKSEVWNNKGRVVFIFVFLKAKTIAQTPKGNLPFRKC